MIHEWAESKKFQKMISTQGFPVHVQVHQTCLHFRCQLNRSIHLKEIFNLLSLDRQPMALSFHLNTFVSCEHSSASIQRVNRTNRKSDLVRKYSGLDRLMSLRED